MTEHDIDYDLAALEEAIDKDDEELGKKVGLRLVGTLLKTLVRIAKALERA